MSDNWLKFVPTNPDWQPTTDAAEAATTLLASFLPEAGEIRTEFSDDVRFVDPGGNLEGISCPACGADILEWWPDAMQIAYERNFSHLETVMTCCRAEISLNDLRYNWPAAFGRFVLSAKNPNARDTASEQDKALADCIGHALRKIWVHI